MAVPHPTVSPPAWQQRLRATLAGLGPATPLFVAAMAGPLLGATALVATTPAWLPLLADDAGTALLFVLLGSVATAGCLLPTHATSLVAGFVFGPWLGPVLAWLVILLAATAGFTVLRWLVGGRVLRALAASPRAAVVHQALLGEGFWRAAGLIALLRLSPLMPFAATNLLLAALHVPVRTFLPATLAGITPRAVAVALLGAELQALDWGASGSPWWTAVAIAATVAVLLLVGRTAKAALRRRLQEAAGRGAGG